MFSLSLAMTARPFDFFWVGLSWEKLTILVGVEEYLSEEILEESFRWVVGAEKSGSGMLYSL